MRIWGRAVTPGGVVDDALVTLDGEAIGSVAPRRDARPEPGWLGNGTGWVIPGLVSLHVHGGRGADFIDPGPEAPGIIDDYLASQGITSYLATLVSAGVEDMAGAASRIAARAREAGSRPGGTGLLGIHLEGPFLNPRRRGLHAAEVLRAPDRDVLERLVAGIPVGLIRWMTLAPELEGAMDLLEAARAAGVRVALGHSEASYDQVRFALGRGACHATHLFNAMGPLHHREPGIVGAFLDDPAATVEVIPDALHLHPALLALVYRVKGPDRMVLVTDSLAPAGLGDGDHRWCGRVVSVRDGRAVSEHGPIGSILETKPMFEVLHRVGIPVEDIVRMAASTPASILGLADRGVLEAGRRADVVLMDRSFAVRAVFRAGRCVPDAGGQGSGGGPGERL